MLIDNREDYSNKTAPADKGIKTVVDFIRRYTGPDSRRSGSFDIVTGYFTIAGLDLLYRELNPSNTYRLVLSELVDDTDFISRVINLLRGDGGIDATLRLSQEAQNAIAFLKRETVQVRAVTHAFCHAKAYIYKDATDDAHDYYLTGSSNLTEASLGLRNSPNVELNFANTGSTNGEYAQLRRWFKTQWETVAKSTINPSPKDPKSRPVDVKQYFIERIEECFGRTRTPEEIYYKILAELFAGELDLDNQLMQDQEMTLFQDSTIYKTLFDYQKKGVISLINMLRKWHGAILADAVGLGKTFSALAVMKYFQNNGYQVLVLCPKKLEQNWKQYLRRRGSRFERDEFDYIVRFHTDLQDNRLERLEGVKLSWIKRQQKLLVVVDESHNLRNDNSSRYQTLLNDILSQNASNVTREVKVLLLSATPINNSLEDIRNQFKLLAKGDNAAFKVEPFRIDNLDQLFRKANGLFKKWCERENRTIADFIGMLDPRFFELTDRLLVARTRGMIERTLGENLGFPQKLPPSNEYVGLKGIGSYRSIGEAYEALHQIQLTAYNPSQFMQEKVEAKRNWQDNTFRETYLVEMMSVLFMKRLESCWLSCLTTIEKVLQTHRDTLAKVNDFLAHGNHSSIDVAVPGGEEGDDDEGGEFYPSERNHRPRQNGTCRRLSE